MVFTFVVLSPPITLPIPLLLQFPRVSDFASLHPPHFPLFWRLHPPPILPPFPSLLSLPRQSSFEFPPFVTSASSFIPPFHRYVYYSLTFAVHSRFSGSSPLHSTPFPSSPSPIPKSPLITLPSIPLPQPTHMYYLFPLPTSRSTLTKHLSLPHLPPFLSPFPSPPMIHPPPHTCRNRRLFPVGCRQQ